MGVYICNWMKFTHSSATLGHACTHNMSTTRGKHKHTTNKHGPPPPHPPAVWHEKPHNYMQSQEGEQCTTHTASAVPHALLN